MTETDVIDTTYRWPWDDHLKHEAEVIWLEDPEQFDYVRQVIVPWARTRRRPLKLSVPGRVVGYTVLRADAPRVTVQQDFLERE